MEKADIIIKSKNIFSGVGDLPFEGGVAIKGNRIIGVGRPDYINDFISDDTVLLDCESKFVMPGFIDAHMHYFCGVFQSSKYMNRDLFSCRSEKECVDIIKAFGQKHPEYEKITGMGWFPMLWDDKKALPSKKTLDEIEPNRPVYLLSADGHTFWLNTKALEACGITSDTKVTFGSIGKDASGELNGLLFEIEAEESANALAFQLPEDDAENLCMSFNDQLLSCGVTSTTDMSVNPEPVGEFSEYAIAEKLEQEGKLKVRLNLYPSLGIVPDTTTAQKLRKKYHSDRLRIAGLKQFVDGVSSTYTAYLLEEYDDRKGHRGSPCYDYETIRDCVTNANKNGFSVKLHTIGDGAIRLALDAFEYAKSQSGNTQIKNNLEHLEAIHPDDIPRFAKLNVTASMQPLHIPPTAYEKKVRLGEERCKYQWPFKSLIESGANLAFGTDYPVAPFNPLLSVHDAVARTDESGEPIGINDWEKIKVADALKAYTIGSAYALGQDHLLGTLETGKLADVIVLDQNPFSISIEKIKGISVDLTIVDGEIVYRRTQE